MQQHGLPFTLREVLDLSRGMPLDKALPWLEVQASDAGAALDRMKERAIRDELERRRSESNQEDGA